MANLIFSPPLLKNCSPHPLQISHAQCTFTPLRSKACTKCTALPPQKLFNFFRGLVENFTQFPSISESFYPPHTKNIVPIVSKFDMHSAHSLPYAARHAPSAPLYPPRNYSTFFAAWSKISHNFLQFPNLSTPLTQKLFYLSSPNLTCTVHIHSPTQRGMHQVHRFTPPKLFNFFRGLVENFTQFPSISESFYPPYTKNILPIVSKFHMHNAHSLPYAARHAPSAPLYPPKIIQLFSRLGRKFPQFPSISESFYPPRTKNILPIVSKFDMHNAHSLPYAARHAPSAPLYPPRNYSTFFAAWSKISHNFLQFPNLSTPLTQKILYLSSPNLTCTVHIHSPTQRGMHQVHRFTPPEIIQLFSRLGRKFPQFPSISESFYPPHTKNILPIVSKFDMHSAHSLPYAARHAPSAPLYPPKIIQLFSRLGRKFPQFPSISESFYPPRTKNILPIVSKFDMHSAHSLPYAARHAPSAPLYPPKIIQLFSRLGRKFPTISYNFRIFLPPLYKKYSTYLLQI